LHLKRAQKPDVEHFSVENAIFEQCQTISRPKEHQRRVSYLSLN